MRRLQYGFLLPIVLFVAFLFYGYMLNANSRVEWLKEIGIVTQEDYQIAKERPYTLLKMIKPDAYIGILDKVYIYRVGDIDLNGRVEKYDVFTIEGLKTLKATPFSYGYIRIDLKDLKNYLLSKGKTYFVDYIVINISKGDCTGDLFIKIKDMNKEYSIKVDKENFIYKISGKQFYLYNLTNILIYCSWKPSLSLYQYCNIKSINVYALVYDKFKMSRFIIIRDYKKFVNESVNVELSFIIAEGKGNLYIYKGNKIIDKLNLNDPQYLGYTYNYTDNIFVKNISDLTFGFKVDYDSYTYLSNVLLKVMLNKEKQLMYSTGYIKFLPDAYKYYIISGKLQITLQIDKVLREGDLIIRIESSDGNYYEEKVHIKDAPKFYTLRIPPETVKEIFKPENYVVIKITGDGLFHLKRIMIENYK